MFQPSVGFSEVDYRNLEGSGEVRVVVSKEGANLEELVVTVTTLTYDEFYSKGFTLSEDFAGKPLPDPAECKQCHWVEGDVW